MRIASRFLHAVAFAGTAALGACGRPASPVPVAARAPVAPALTESEIRELDIEYLREREKRDPTGATDPARLGALYLGRGRESGDPRDMILAEEAARRSLRNRASHNLQAAQVLQASLLAQHRFAEARRIAVALRDGEPENAGYQASAGEIWMELGEYDSARVAFASVRAAAGDPAVAPRLARWAEINGETDKARRVMRAGLATVLKLADVPREQVAWYWMRVGDIERRAGNLAAADSAYGAGLAVRPDDYRLLSAAAHSALLQRNWTRAVDLGEQSIAQLLDPATLGTLSDAHAAMGDTAKSNEYARVLDAVVLQQPGEYHRAWSLFLLDRGRHATTIHRKVREELRTRKDIYAFDLLAWSLHKQGRHREASAAMQRALSLGTRDPQLAQHAAAIQQALEK